MGVVEVGRGEKGGGGDESGGAGSLSGKEMTAGKRIGEEVDWPEAAAAQPGDVTIRNDRER